MNELIRSGLNCEITNILATGKNNNKLWMRVNPALGTMVFVVAEGGRQICETLSLEKAINAYNGLGNERSVA